MKGDYVQVTYRMPTGTTTDKIVAEKDGSDVEYKMPDRGSTFVTVEVLNKAGAVTMKAQYQASEIIAIREGHEQLKRKRG